MRTRCATLLVLVTGAALTTACQAPRSETVDDRPAIERTLRAFYRAVIADQDFAAACRHTSPRFSLRPALYAGGNIDSAQEPTLERRRRSRRPPARRSCEEMAKTIFDARGDQYPFTAWEVESVTVARGGRTAEAVTSDGSAGLEKVDGRWLVLWAFDAAP